MKKVQRGVHLRQSKSISARLRNLLYYPWSPRPFAFQSEIGYTLTAPNPPPPADTLSPTMAALLLTPQTRHPKKLIWMHQRHNYVQSLKWRYAQLKVIHKSGCLYVQQDWEGAWQEGKCSGAIIIAISLQSKDYCGIAATTPLETFKNNHTYRTYCRYD